MAVLALAAAGCSRSESGGSAAATNAAAVNAPTPGPASAAAPGVSAVTAPAPAPAQRSAAGKVVDDLTGKTMVDMHLKTRAKIQKINEDRNKEFEEVQNKE